MSHKKGFTLLEMLIVILIVAIVTGVVAPIAYKSVDKFKSYQQSFELSNMKKMKTFLSFVTSSKCKMDNESGIISCGNLKYRF